MSRIKEFFKKETVLAVSALAAIATMFLVPPDVSYIGYIDFKVLCLLFCLMAVVEGFQYCGIFGWLCNKLLKLGKNGRLLGVTLVLLPFFSAMIVTNDVALLTFVPFTVMLLGQINHPESIIPVLVLQTVAANLGSMATPVGNPQNLFLYGHYDLSIAEFFSAVQLLTLISLILLSAAAMFVLPRQLPEIERIKVKLQHRRKLILFTSLFTVCLLTVFRILHYGIMMAIVVVALLIFQPGILKKPDIALLLTFVCFFIVSGNLGRMDTVRDCLEALLGKSTLLTAAAASQVISNVPAAVLLSGFTDQWCELMQGVNIGGLGTPIASLASLITLKLYLRTPDADAKRFMAIFMLANIAGLAILLPIAALIG